MFKWEDAYMAYINLSHRQDRNEHMLSELARVGLTAERFEAINTKDDVWNTEAYRVMFQRTRGAIGCHLSQTSVMKTALDLNKHVVVCEDDLVFCSDFKERIKIIEDFLSGKDWHIFWLGGTWHPSSQTWWHRIGHSADLPQCDCTLGVDAEATEDKRFVRTYGAFSTHCYIVNNRFIEPLLEYLESNVHLSMGIDWLMILLQPKINSYAFVPGCAKQLDNQSDIGTGMTIFSGFASLGPHWYQDKMEDFDYNNFRI